MEEDEGEDRGQKADGARWRYTQCMAQCQCNVVMVVEEEGGFIDGVRSSCSRVPICAYDLGSTGIDSQRS